MKMIKLLATAAALATAMTAQTAWAADVTASAVIVKPIVVTATKALNFGNVIAGTSQGTFIINATDGLRNNSSSLFSPTTQAGTQQAGEFTVAGSEGLTYTVSINTDGTDIAMAGGTGDVKVGSFTLAKGGTAVTVTSGVSNAITVSTGGTDTLTIGGTLTVPAGSYGTFSATIPVTAAYN